jgi:hypothetical protein
MPLTDRDRLGGSGRTIRTKQRAADARKRDHGYRNQETGADPK